MALQAPTGADFHPNPKFQSSPKKLPCLLTHLHPDSLCISSTSEDRPMNFHTVRWDSKTYRRCDNPNDT